MKRKIKFICKECKKEVNWDRFEDGTPICPKCDVDMVVKK